MLLFGLFVMVSSFATAQTYKYVGASKCKMCHNKPTTGMQYKKWAEGPHANAMKALKGDEAKDPKCLKCHSTAASVDPGLLAGLSQDEGVSCESCHGPGSVYKSARIMRNTKLAMSKGLIMPDAKVCKQCHNEESPTFKGFNFEEYKAKIAHPNPQSK